jgi:hypothetical protein
LKQIQVAFRGSNESAIEPHSPRQSRNPAAFIIPSPLQSFPTFAWNDRAIFLRSTTELQHFAAVDAPKRHLDQPSIWLLIRSAFAHLAAGHFARSSGRVKYLLLKTIKIVGDEGLEPPTSAV